MCVCSRPLSSPPCGVRSPSNTIPPVHPAANGDLEFSGVAIFCIPALVQVGLRVPTPMSGQSSCELLALLQEFASIGSECLLNAQAAWLCQVSVTAQRQQYNLHILHFAFCVCMYVCTEAVLSV